MEEAVTDQIVRTTQIQIDQTEKANGMLEMNHMGGMTGAPGLIETDTQRADAIDENIVDIHTQNKF